MNFLLYLLWFLFLDFVFFVIVAKYQGYKCGYDCFKCKNWACTHGTQYEGKGFYPFIDWSKFCLK